MICYYKVFLAEEISLNVDCVKDTAEDDSDLAENCWRIIINKRYRFRRAPIKNILEAISL